MVEESKMVTETADCGPQVQTFGDPDVWQLLCKVSFAGQGVTWMKSTKVMQLPHGVLVQVTTEKRGAVAEALAYVPGVKIVGEHGERTMVPM